jgi:hypothetical protein
MREAETRERLHRRSARERRSNLLLLAPAAPVSSARDQNGEGDDSGDVCSADRFMRLHHTRIAKTGSTVRLIGHVERQRHPHVFDVYFEFAAELEPAISDSADPFAVTMLVPAMLAGEPLEIGPAISPLLHFQLPRVRDIFHMWYPELTAVEINTTRGAPTAPASVPRAATFFSGGVDSFYTLLRHRRLNALPAPLTHIVFMRGIEKPLDFAKGVEESQQRAEAIAARTGVQCIAGETNLRTYFDPPWLTHYSGSGLAATALSLAGGFTHICIPASYSYAYPVRLGSTPLVDERFSTEQLQIVHDGAEIPRPEKLARILEWDRDLVLAHLRVCTMNFGGAYNCCNCRKCVRAMVPLRFLRALDEAALFPNKSPQKWERIASRDPLPWLEENLEFGRLRATDPELTAMLERLVRRARRKKAITEAFENSPVAGLLPVLLGMRRWVRRRLAG